MATKCYCLHSCPIGSVNQTCDLEPGGYCFSAIKVKSVNFEGLEEYETRYGCFPPDVKGLLPCKGNRPNHSVPLNITCCQSADYCNKYNLPKIDLKVVEEYKTKLINEPELEEYIPLYVWNIIVLIIVGITLFILLAVLFKCILKKNRKFEKKLSESEDSIEKLPYHLNGTIKPLLSSGYNNNNSIYIHCPSVNCRPPSSCNSSIRESSSGTSTIKYPQQYYNLSNSHSHSSNYTLNSYRNMSHSATTSNTTCSLASEITQQTTLSSQKHSSTTPLPPLSEFTSGSGSGTPYLVKQTLAHETRLVDCIGGGRYGNVYRGTRKGVNMAVKIFFTRDEAFWKKEVDIYTTVLHENILGFLGADIISKHGCTELWLVTEYHAMGSLYDYLNQHPINSSEQMLSIMNAIICGLSHLHTEIIGTHGKPGIAHRDIKSKNILMKSDFSCCIADFGLAVIKTQNNEKNISENIRVGTKRYMAPEILNGTITSEIFDSYKAADVYSLALVFWEIFNRLELNGAANIYRVPYYDLVPDDPSIDDMYQVVWLEKKRPQFEIDFTQDKILRSVHTLITECWAQIPSARLPSLRIKKNILDLLYSDI